MIIIIIVCLFWHRTIAAKSFAQYGLSVCVYTSWLKFNQTHWDIWSPTMSQNVKCIIISLQVMNAKQNVSAVIENSLVLVHSSSAHPSGCIRRFHVLNCKHNASVQTQSSKISIFLLLSFCRPCYFVVIWDWYWFISVCSLSDLHAWWSPALRVILCHHERLGTQRSKGNGVFCNNPALRPGTWLHLPLRSPSAVYGSCHCWGFKLFQDNTFLPPLLTQSFALECKTAQRWRTTRTVGWRIP